MAQEFGEWLQTAIQNHTFGLEKPILIVGVTGKTTSIDEKNGLIDQILEYSVFCGRYKEENAIKIDAFYSEFHQIVFLCLNSYQDVDVQEKLFNSDKSFFDVLAEAERLYIEYLFVLSTLSHLLIFLHPDTRGDTTILRHLISVNEMRVQRRPQLMQKLENINNFPSVWQEEGRIALPRMLFIFRDNRSRSSYSKMSSDELSNSIDRLERTREFQLVHMFKRCQIVAEHLGIALASLTPHRVPFVHVLMADESEVGVVNNVLYQLFCGNILFNEFNTYLDHQTTTLLPLEKRLDVSKFILGHVKDIVKNENNLPYFFLLPKFKDFVSGAKEVLQAITTDEIYSQELIKNWLSEEVHFLDDAISQISFYAYELYNALILDEKIGPMFFDPNLSEFRHYRALQYVGSFLKVTLNQKQLTEAWPKLIKQCNSRFKSRRNQCTTESISGIRCSLLIHKLPAEYSPDQSIEDSLRGRSFNHCSGYCYFSACGCGKTQKRRLDPFTAKEANYDFYSSFTCCTKTEAMPFTLYNPEIKWDVSQTKSVTVKKRGRGVTQNHAENVTDNNSRNSTYTIMKPKSKERMMNELLWQFNKMTVEHKGKYSEHMPYSSDSTDILPPLFPSWSVLCIGSSKLYVHSKGCSDPGFLRGSEFLMPYDLNMNVKNMEWANGMKDILKVDRLPYRERRNDENGVDKTHKEKLKFFVGIEFECPEGHRFFIDGPNKMLIHDKMNGNVTTDAINLVEAEELPLMMPCKCSNGDTPVYAQMMRLHVVTPKAPVYAKLNPRISFDGNEYFHLGTSAELNWGRYYILRLPFVYDGPNGIVSKTNGKMLSDWIRIYQKI